MNRRRNLLVIAGLLGALLLVYAALPLGTAIELGGDEGIELSKGVLCAKGFALYKEIWSDQPPLFSKLLGWAFHVFGTSALVARLLAAAFGLLLFGALYRTVSQHSDRWCGLFAAFFLAASPGVLLLSVSVMQEVPAFGMALLSIAILQQWRNQSDWRWLLASGAILGLALQLKFTAALVVPAMLLEIALSIQGSNSERNRRQTAVLTASLWLLGAVASFGFVYLLFGHGSLETSKAAHLLAGDVPTSDTFSKGPNDFPISWGIFWDHSESLAAALAAILMAFARKRFRELAIPLTLLLTALAIHLVHRPWWPYYYLHIAIPLAWLAAVAVVEAVIVCSRLLSIRPFRLSTLAAWKALFLSVFVGLVVVRSELRLEAGIKEMRERPTADSHPLVQKMRQYAPRTHWAYAERQIFTFHASLLMPPQLAVVTPKRFWSGQITTPQIIEICKRYQLEQVLLDLPIARKEWRQFLKDDFEVVWSDDKFVLYVAITITQTDPSTKTSATN